MSKLREKLNLVERLQELFDNLDENHSSSRLVKKYIGAVNSVDSYTLINGMIREMRAYDWVEPISNFIKSLEKDVYESSSQMKVEKSINELKNSAGTSYAYKAYDSAINILNEFVDYDGEDMSDKLNSALNESLWIPQVKTLISELKNSEQKLEETATATVSKVYSPIDVIDEGENESLKFYLSGRIYEMKNGEITISKNPSSEFVNLVKIIENAKIVGNTFSFSNLNSVVKITLNEDKVDVYVNDKLVEEENLERYLLSTGAFRVNEMDQVRLIEFTAKNIDKLVEMDFIDSIESKKFKGVITNVIKVDENIYINKVNPSMSKNDLVKAESGENAVSLVKEFINYDISNSIVDLLEGEAKEKAILDEAKNQLEERIAFLNEKLEEIAKAEAELGEVEELKEAKKIILESIEEQKTSLGTLISK